MEGSFFYIEKFLKKNFQNKEITIVLTPLPGDIISFKNGNNYKSLNWFKILKNLGLKYNVKIIDLMDNLDTLIHRSVAQMSGHEEFLEKL